MNKALFIDYLKHLGATEDEATHTYNQIQNDLADGIGRIDILQALGLPLDLADLL